MYFADMSSYSYSYEDDERFNIGWLAADHSYRSGEVDPLVQAALRYLLRFQVNLTRGVHRCDFCGSVDIFVEDGLGERCKLGIAEILVEGEGDLRFASPSLIVHYIEAHDYSPPREFQGAVLLGARRLGWETLE